MDGMTLLEQYPIAEAGGIERIVQVADDILHQREQSANQAPTEAVSLTAKLRDVVWRGFGSQSSDPVYRKTARMKWAMKRRERLQKVARQTELDLILGHLG